MFGSLKITFRQKLMYLTLNNRLRQLRKCLRMNVDRLFHIKIKIQNLINNLYQTIQQKHQRNLELSIMQQFSSHSTIVKTCKFKLKLIKGTISIMFPSYIFVQVKSLNNHALCQSKQILKSAKSTQIIFNETIQFQTEMLFNKDQNIFHKKDIHIKVNLKSVKNPDQAKLVGSLKINLLDFMSYEQHQAKIKGNKSFQLQFTKDKTLIEFDLSLFNVSESQKRLVDLDKSQFKDAQVNKILTGSNKSIQNQQKTTQKAQNIKNQPIQVINAQSKLQKKISVRSITKKQSISEQSKQQNTLVSPRKLQTIRNSIFQDQEQYIYNLQQQLQETNEILQQYKLQVELMKAQVEEYQHNKPYYIQLEHKINDLEIRVQRNNNESYEVKTEQKSSVVEYKIVEAALSQANQKIKEFWSVIQQKEEIITAKDSVIQQKSKQVQILDKDFKEYVELKNQEYQILHSNFTNLKQNNHSLLLQLQNSEKEIQQLRTLEEKSKQQHFEQMQKIKNDILKIDTLNFQINKLAETLQRKQHELDEQKQKYQVVQHTAFKCQQKIIKLQKQLSMVEKQYNSFMKKYEKHQVEAQKAIQKAKTIQKEKYQLNEKIKNFQLQKKQYRKSLDEEINTLKKQVSQWELTYQQASNKNSQLKFAVQSYETTLLSEQSKFTEIIGDLQKKVSKHRQKQQLLNYTLNIFQRQVRSINELINQKQLQIQDNNFTIQQSKAKINDLIQKNMFMERKLRMSLNQLDSAKYQLKVYKSKLQTNSNQNSEQSNYQNKKQAHLIIIETANRQIIVKNNQLSEQLIGLQSQLQFSNQKLKQLATTIQKNKKLTQKINKLQKQIETRREQEKKLTKQLAKAKQEIKAVSQQYKNQKQMVQKLSTQVGELQQLKFSLYSQNNQKQVQISRICMQNEQLMEQCKRVSKQKDQLLQINMQEEDKINQLKQKITQLQQKINLQQSSNQKEEKTLPAPILNARDVNANVSTLKKQIQSTKMKQQEYLKKIQNLQKQLASLKTSIGQTYPMNGSAPKTNKPHQNKQVGTKKQEDMQIACKQLQKLLEGRIKNRQSQNFMQILISNSQISQFSHDQQFGKRDVTRVMQQKSKILSRELLKIKSMIVKNDYKSAKDKNSSSSQLIERLKPCEMIVNELVKLCENVEMNMDEDYEMM